MKHPERLLSGENLRQLMRHHHLTIATLAERLGLPQSRVRWRLAQGFTIHEVATLRDWVQAIMLVDPGNHSESWWVGVALLIGSRRWTDVTVLLVGGGD